MAKISQSSAFAATQEIGVQTHSQPAYSRPSRRETFWKDVSKKLRIVIHYKWKPISCTWHRNLVLARTVHLEETAHWRDETIQNIITKLCKNQSKNIQITPFYKGWPPCLSTPNFVHLNVRINSSVSRVTSGTLYSRIGFLHDTSTSSQPHKLCVIFSSSG